jgi:hypothetical protein
LLKVSPMNTKHAVTRTRSVRASLILAGCLLASACIGEIGDADSEQHGAIPPGPGPGPTGDLFAASGLRRLTSDEYDSVLRDLLMDNTEPANLLLPEDVRTPFDNDYEKQVPSFALIQGADLLAADAAERLLANTQARDEVVGCVPTGPDDDACFRHFVVTFGRRALRRRLTGEDVERFMALQAHAVAADDFYAGIATAVRAFLQHPEFLYRVEIGTAVPESPGVFRLDDWEMASRLSFLLWATAPDPWLLDLAEAGQLHEPEQIRAAAIEMLSSHLARRTVARFHALWMGYERMPLSADLVEAMQTETKALLDRVIFEEQRGWQDIFTEDETFISDDLASHYGIPAPGSDAPVWTSYADSGRRGILSHGSFLSAGNKFEDTSPTMRGLLIRTRLFCQDMPPPPPGVDTDDPIPDTPESACKWDRYEVHRQGGCASCHSMMDPVGFGLENYDSAGKYRTHDIGHPECTIEGKGELVGVGTFQGPAELGDLMVSSGLLNRCVATQLHRFAVGRYELDDIDELMIDRIMERVANQEGFRFTDLLLDTVSSESFGYRREAEEIVK